jgi:cation diffusion facilitator family transporter
MTGNHDPDRWRHAHDFGTDAERHAERRTGWVVAVAFVTMLVEMAAGWLTGSMALTADAWHMASHVGALGMSALAYRVARSKSTDSRFTFGTGKIAPLAGYTSSLLLGLVAIWMAWESASRLLTPVEVHYTEAMIVAAIGLAVNLGSAWLLGDSHVHEDGGPVHAHDHVDHNLKAAYLHVLADALTSLLAILALAGGMIWGWRMLDPLMGLVGGIVVGRWAWSLSRDTADVLLDAENHDEVAAAIRRTIEALPDHEVTDLHVWRIGTASRACIVSLVSHAPQDPDDYRRMLANIPGLHHVTVEPSRCRDCS